MSNLNDTEALARLEAFWNRSSIGRPALRAIVSNRASWVGGTGTTADKAQTDYSQPRPANLLEHDLWPDFHRFNIQKMAGEFGYLAEAMPGHHVQWGSSLTTLAVLAGGDYEYHDSAWIKTIPDIFDRPLPTFDPASPATQMLDRAYQAAKAACPADQFITPPLMMDGLSTLGMFREFEHLCTDLVDRPEWVKAWSSRLTDMYIAIYEHYYRLLGYGKSLCFFQVLAQGRSEGVQCDFAVHLSPAMFDEFVLPDLRRTTDYMDRSLYHLDGTCQMRFLDSLRACPKLTGIQWNPEPPAGAPTKWIDAFREIRRRDFCIMIWAEVDEAIAITRELGPDGLFFVLPQFKTTDDALQAIERIEKSCR